ncbi:hypothetical protein PGH07_07610 [Sulfurovum sp. zt1-1]|uniref:Uncharacterized protein n=1 Tax=Sulfurovum zhangzhouensis TaxID=3019067 RepID=A0ABT7QYY4_9BACT|nr:hypothetical protein [Sulfurovum zhangzhouensis]MDM5272042.1 hypothetical protein [Sulfurovum zhangzhouensis]
MDRCSQIKASVRMEEKYAGMCLTFDRNDQSLLDEVNEAIVKVNKEMKMTPLIWDNLNNKTLYVEFKEDVQRDSGVYFEKLLRELKIDKCENDIFQL